MASPSPQNEVVVRQTSFQGEVEAYSANIRDALPPHVSVAKFKRVLITAVGQNPDLLYANRRTLFIAALRAASEGLLPDGRECALVVFNTEVKQRDPQTGLDRKFRMDVVQYMPMIAGIRKRMRNSGDILSATAEVVHKNDEFRYAEGDEPFIAHTPAPLGHDRGPVVGAYAIIKLRSGEVLRDVMDLPALEKTRSKSRARDSLMWKDFPEEGYKKTVLRRCAKAAPQTAEVEALLGGPEEELPALPAPPAPPVLQELPPPVEIVEEEYAVISREGEEFVFQTPQTAARGLLKVYEDAAKLGLADLTGVHETNVGLIEQLKEEGYSELAAEIEGEYARLLAASKPPPVAEVVAPPQPPPPVDPPAQRPPDAPAVAANDEGDSSHEYEIQPVLRRGQPDWHAWAVGLFVPKLRKITDASDMALFLADNDKHLEEARGRLDRSDREAVEAAIQQQWTTIG
jgi:phage RecT family recombinase